MAPFFIFIALAIVLAAILVRFLSRKKSLPWPHQLTWVLYNPYMMLFCPPKWVIGLLDLPSGARLLDIGCGDGRISLRPFSDGFTDYAVTGVDIQAAMLQRYRVQAAKEGFTRYQLHQLDVSAQALPNGEYHRACLVTVLGEFPNRVDLLQRVFEALAPGGLLVVVEVLPDFCYMTEKVVRHLAEGVGFEMTLSSSRVLSYGLVFTKPMGSKVLVEGLP